MQQAVIGIKNELRLRLDQLVNEGKLLEAQRLEQRTNFDLEMLEATGVCSGIENYSRYLTGRAPGEPPPTLFGSSPTMPLSSPMKATSACRRLAQCIKAIIAVNSPLPNMGSDCRLVWTTARLSLRNGMRCGRSPFLSRHPIQVGT